MNDIPMNKTFLVERVEISLNIKRLSKCVQELDDTFRAFDGGASEITVSRLSRFILSMEDGIKRTENNLQQLSETISSFTNTK